MSDSTFVFAVIAVAAVLMASNRVRFDVIALMVVLALMLSGVLTVSESLAGSGSSVVILVAGLLIVGEMLARSDSDLPGRQALCRCHTLRCHSRREIHFTVSTRRKATTFCSLEGCRFTASGV